MEKEIWLLFYYLEDSDKIMPKDIKGIILSCVFLILGLLFNKNGKIK